MIDLAPRPLKLDLDECESMKINYDEIYPRAKQPPRYYVTDDWEDDKEIEPPRIDSFFANSVKVVKTKVIVKNEPVDTSALSIRSYATSIVKKGLKKKSRDFLAR